MPRNSGVYVITNTMNNKAYIGGSINLLRRGRRHRNSLRRGTHHNPGLQSAWDKYGEEVFKFGTLEFQPDEKLLPLTEQFWADVYRMEGKYLYNCGRFTGKQGPETPYPPYYNTSAGTVWYEDTGPQRPAWHTWVYGGMSKPPYGD